MKRYFKPVARDASFKRLCSATDDNNRVVQDAPQAVGPLGGDSLTLSSPEGLENEGQGLTENPGPQNPEPGCGPESGAGAAKEGFCQPKIENERLGSRDPCRFMSWNANSFLIRMKNNQEEFVAFVKKFDPDVITRALSNPPLSEYQAWWSLADSKYGGTALLVKRSCPPQRVSFCLDPDATSDAAPALGIGLLGGQRGRGPPHEPEGRAILAEFAHLRVLNTYAPNNGWRDGPQAFGRRRAWDARALAFVERQLSGKPLVWCGDLNCSHTDADDFGQPGFTPNERKRFSLMLQRLLHSPPGAPHHHHRDRQQLQGAGGAGNECGNGGGGEDPDAGFTWSGHPVGKFRGKRMRIDYFLVSQSLAGRVLRCEHGGRGTELEGYLGSDHCPVTLQLRKQADGTRAL
eukprot:jgi/Mesen1/4062/ME000213S03085